MDKESTSLGKENSPALGLSLVPLDMTLGSVIQPIQQQLLCISLVEERLILYYFLSSNSKSSVST